MEEFFLGVGLEIWLTIGAVIALIALSAFFSGSETALTAVSRPRMHHLARKGNVRAGVVRRLSDRKEDLLGALLLGNNMVNILAASLATSLAIKLFGEAGVVYATGVMTLLVLVFAEVLPKTFAINHPDKSALAVAPIVRLVVAVFSPIARAVQKIVRAVLYLLGDKPNAALRRETLDEEREEALRGAIELHHGTDAETESERKMLKSILELADLEVEEVMTHRRNVIMVDGDRPSEEIVAEVLASAYTRIPIMRDTQENIVGVLHAKALLRAVHAAGGDANQLDLLEIASPPGLCQNQQRCWINCKPFGAGGSTSRWSWMNMVPLWASFHLRIFSKKSSAISRMSMICRSPGCACSPTAASSLRA
jgi:Mg2+/Co2+ transporter CorB